jgi:hypothetical protein
LPKLVARKLIHWAGRIDASPGIAIPIPDAASTVPDLKYLDGNAAQTVKEIEASKSRADDDGVVFFGLGVVRPFRLDSAHMMHIPSKIH